MNPPHATPAPVLSVVLPNFNGEQLLEANLPSVFAACEVAGIAHEVLVVDDGSTDGSLNWLDQMSRRHLTLRAIPKSVNEGFSATCNRGIEAARGEFLCLLNTDVQLPSDFFLLALVPLLAGDADVVSVTVENYRDDSSCPASVTRPVRIHLRHGYVRILRDRKAEGPDGIPVAMLGCCFLARGAALRALGGYDERYSPFYWEDLDLGLRVHRAGLRERYVETVRVVHRESSTVKLLDPQRLRSVATIRTRNRMLLGWDLVDGINGWIVQVAWEFWYLATRWVRGEWHYYPAWLSAVRLARSPRRLIGSAGAGAMNESAARSATHARRHGGGADEQEMGQ